MFHFSGHTLTHLLADYGYWVVLLFVAVESTGIPFPGETMLLAAAIYAGTHHSFHIPLVIVAAAGSSGPPYTGWGAMRWATTSIG